MMAAIVSVYMHHLIVLHMHIFIGSTSSVTIKSAWDLLCRYTNYVTMVFAAPWQFQ